MDSIIVAQNPSMMIFIKGFCLKRRSRPKTISFLAASAGYLLIKKSLFQKPVKITEFH